MLVALSHPRSQRWLGPILLAIIMPLLFAALPGEPLQTLAREAAVVKQVGREIATLHTVRSGFQQVRDADRDMLSEPSTQVQKLAISGVRQALDRMRGNAAPAGANVAAVKNAIDAYAQIIPHATDVARFTEPATQALPVTDPAAAIGSVLGQLQARDEARLQEPLLAMRLAEAALRSEHDPRVAEQLSRWAGIFAARLDAMAIPHGTRANLEARLAVYEHAVFSVNETSLRQRVDSQSFQAARVVETALAKAERALTTEQQRRNDAFEVACNGFLWSLGAALAASLLIVGGGMFGNIALDRGVMRTRNAR